MVVQEYIICLSNGDTVTALEPFDMEGPETLISQYGNAKPDKFFCVGNAIEGFHYFRARNIVQIYTGDVKEVNSSIYGLEQIMKRSEDKMNNEEE